MEGEETEGVTTKRSRSRSRSKERAHMCDDFVVCDIDIIVTSLDDMT